ncbi:MAG: hypothetical protein ACKPI8_05950, partial [Microcystis panniformis]
PDQLATPALILRTDNREICIKSYKHPKPDLPQAIALRKRVSQRNPFSGLRIDKKVILDKIGGGVESWWNLPAIVHEYYNYLQISVSLWCCLRQHS